MSLIHLSPIPRLPGVFFFLAMSFSAAVSAACVDPNTCFGTGALDVNTGTDNSAFGYRALNSNANGGDNTAVGAAALSSNTDGFFNVAVGATALRDNSSGRSNVAIGTKAMRSTSGSRNIAIGEFALAFDGGGSDHIAIGYFALGNGGPGGDHYQGQRNIAIGRAALQTAAAGADNIALGNTAMAGSIAVPNFGSRNTAIGTRVLLGNKFGNNNTAVGHEAMVGLLIDEIEEEFEQNGSNNTALGSSTLKNNHDGNSNTAAGFEALFTNKGGSNNTATGSRALRAVTTGADNVALGHRAGASLTTGSYNIIIGSNNAGTAGDTNVIRIGTNANQKKTYIAGIRGVTTGLTGAVQVMIDANGQLGTVKSSRDVKEDIQPMGDVSERIMSLQPVTFHYKEADEDGNKPIQFGLIAEDVAQVFPELVVRDLSGKVETVSYHLLSTLLVNELQKEHRVNESQAERIASLETQVAEIAELKSALAKMTQTVEQLNRARTLAAN